MATTSVWAGTATITSPTPTQAFNTAASTTLTFSTTDPILPTPAPAPAVTLRRNGASGDTITPTVVNVPAVGTVQATFDFRLANPSFYDVDITQGAFDETCTACFTVFGSPVAVSSVNPAVLGEGGGTNSFVINGSNFAKGPYDGTGNGSSVELFLHGTNTPDPDATIGPALDGSGNTIPPTTSSITLRLQLASVKGEHFDDVQVTNTDHTTSTCSSCLEVRPQPTITSVTGPVGSTVGQNAQHQQIVISGDNFAPDAHVSVSPPSQTAGSMTFTQSAPVSAGSQADPNLQQITLSDVDTTGVTAAGTGASHMWPVTVSSASLSDSSGTALLTVTPAPTATSIAYDNGASDIGEGAQAKHIAVGGTGIVPGTVLSFSPALPAGVTLGTPQVSGQTVTAQVDVAPGSSEIGTYSVRLVNPDGGTSAPCAVPAPSLPPGGSPTPCPLVIAAGPSVTSIGSSSTVTPGYSGALTITGSSLHTSGGVHVVISSGNTSYFSTDATAVDQGNGTQTITLAAGPVKVPANASAGTADVTVTNLDDGGMQTKTGLLNVRSLSVTGVNPTFDPNTGPAAGVQVTGSNFAPDATVRLQQGDATIPGTNVVVAGDGSSLTADFDLTNVGPGPYQVFVDNPTTDAGESNELVLFSVVAPPPTTTSVSPTSLGGGATNVAVQVTGTNFFHGSTVSFGNPAITLVGSPDINADRTVITQHVNVAPNASAGSSTVTVTDSSLQQSNTQNITLHTAPLVAGVTPSNHSPDAFNVSVAGSGFEPGASLQFDNADVHASNVQVAPDGTTLTADLTFDAGAVPSDAPVPVAVTVVNPDFGQATTAPANDLTLDPEPRITSVTSPIPAGKATPVTIDGANFLPAAAITAPNGSGITVSNVQFVNAGRLTATLTVDPAAARGSRTLTVDNGDGGTGTHGVSVYVAPGQPTGPLSISPGDGALSVSWGAPSDLGGAPTLSSYTVSVTPHVGGPTTSFTTVGPTPTSHNFSSLANGTLYDVSVVATNGAGDSTPLTGSDTPRTVPGAPTGLSLTPGNGTLSVSWGAPVSDGGNAVDKYTVSVTPHAGGTTSSFDTSNASTTSHDFTGLTNGTLYDVTVTAHNAAGSGAAVAGSGTPRTVPSAPTGLTVTPGDGTLTVSWSTPADNGGNAVDKYTVSVTPHSGGSATTFDTSDPSTTSHNFSGLANGALYDVAVTAHNAAGSGAAATGSGTPARASNAPSITAITPGDATIAVTWSAPTANGGAAVQSYRVTITPRSGGSAISITTPDAATTSHTFGGLVNGTTYDVAVAANNSAGRSAAATGSATPRFTSALSIVDSAKTVIYGTKITLSGVLTRSDGSGVAGATVTVTRALDGAAAAAYRTVTTDSTGHWSLTFAPGLNAAYAASFAGNSSVAPSASASSRTTVGPRILIRSPLNKSTSSAATALKVTGSVSPNKAGKAVVLYYVTKTGKLVKLTSGRLSATSTFALTYRLKAGTWHLRVVIGNTAGNVASTSKTLTVKRV